LPARYSFRGSSWYRCETSNCAARLILLNLCRLGVIARGCDVESVRGMGINFVSGLSLAATFEGEFSDVTRSYAGKGVARYTW
jgi:hypothetical protein